MRRLLVIVSDRISNIINKGELIDEYYNPGNYFDEVGIMLTNDDSPDRESLQKAVGIAKLEVFNVPTEPMFLIKTLGWRPILMKKWASKGIELAKRYHPDLIRCYGNRLSGYLSSRIRQELGIPYILSMHEATDDIVRTEKSVFRAIQYGLLESMGNEALHNADKVIAVYESIADCLKKRNVYQHTVIHNSVNGKYIIKKEDYNIFDNKIKAVYVGRIISIKNPGKIIEAMASLKNVELDVIGDGVLQTEMVKLSHKVGCANRVKFIKSMKNDELCRSLHTYDVFVNHDVGAGVPKTVIEAWLAAMPVLTCRTIDNTVEYKHRENIALVEDSVEGYIEGLEWMGNIDNRSMIAEGGYKYARDNFSPEACTQQVVALYKEILGE